MKTDPPNWITADFACWNISKNGPQRKTLFKNKPKGVAYNKLKKLNYEHLKLEKHGHSKFFGEDCVEWFVKEMLGIETYMKHYFEKKINLKPNTIANNIEKHSCW